MFVHVIVASRHGSTREIADELERSLRARGLQTTLVELDDTPLDGLDIGPDDAVILGSGVYAGRWMKSARRFLDRFGDVLRAHRTWLFSSGPLGPADGPEAERAMDDAAVAALEADAGAIGHHLFAGKLDREQLGLVEKLVMSALHEPDGDFRDFDDVRAWANEIADQLVRSSA